jgi:hypothetical protein
MELYIFINIKTKFIVSEFVSYHTQHAEYTFKTLQNKIHVIDKQLDVEDYEMLCVFSLLIKSIYPVWTFVNSIS